ncbi:NAD dependent epimerase/dehydratase [Aaosphaeria arxii CBS 175.79]|uniref:NAD dependent epimerase/dehydratase n=1 Tax=Aaosphaeria arxii CBS 175.79 TaxID=1450172 RepID=A0A6A5XEV2_9PLEO|nr:NAD dependent epimerase/dehydratase [Aaosphaeria arxii CBS 175.79]KAF2011376.1 NAD dependent epimerase/dehydratase [Aaosphaeria arxii CBS 175.79]
MASEKPYILVTGATGFIGAHVVDELLRRNIKVRAATRSLEKGESLKAARPKYTELLDIVQVTDFSEPTSLLDAVKDVTGVIHVASPFTFNVTDNEKELIKPALAGVRAILEAAAENSNVKRIVITSSFASVVDVNRTAPPRFEYTAKDWNPLSYEESVAKETSPVIAYRGSKKFAELEAWKFVEEKKPGFDIVTLCPPMVFGPVVHPLSKVEDLNESNASLWKVASGQEFPAARVPFWVDVRDLAVAHVEALLRPEAGGKRYTVTSPEKYSYGLVADIIKEEFPSIKDRIAAGNQPVVDTHDLDGHTAAKELGVKYTGFKQTVKDFVEEALSLEKANLTK